MARALSLAPPPWSSPRPSDPTGFRPSRSAPRSPLAMLAWNPQVGDLAAQVFRTELFQRGRPGDLERQLVRRPLHPHLQRPLPAAGRAARAAGGRRRSRSSPPPTSSTASSATAGGRRRAGRRSGSPPASSPCSPTASSPSPSASPSASPRCAPCSRPRRRWRSPPPRPARSPARSRPPSSPASVAGRARCERRPPRPTGAAASGRRRSPSASSSIPNLAFPEPGQFPFAFSSYRRDPALVRLGASSSPAACATRSASCAGCCSATCSPRPLIWLAPNPMGGNAVRLGALFGGPVLAAVVLARRPRVSRLVPAPSFMAGGLYWQVTASVSQIARSVGDPSTASRLLRAGRRTGCAPTAARGVRVEVPPTANHWESAYLAPEFELARGWLRQLDTTRDDIFYDDERARPTPPTAPGCATTRSLRRPARRPARLLLGRRAAADPAATRPTSTCAGARRTGGSTRCATPSRWSSRSAAAAAQTLWVGRQGFALDVTRPGELPRPRQLHPLLVDRPRRRLPAPPRRLDRGPRRRTPASSASPPTSRSAAPGTR